MRRLRIRALALVAVLAVVAVAGCKPKPPDARAIPRPSITAPGNVVAGALGSLADPWRDPLGANDWSCRPSSAHPNPVVLVHGTFANAYDSWSGLGPVLRHYGYCVFALNYGAPEGSVFNGRGDIPASAGEIGEFVDDVLAATGAAEVDLVGHSQGGSVSRYYANLIGGDAKVGVVVGLAPSNHATTLLGLATLGRFLGLVDPIFAATDWMGLPSIRQQGDPNSTFYRALNGNGETRPGLRYVNIVTRFDEVVTPYRQGYVAAGSGATVQNTTLQDVCPQDLTDHLGIVYDTNVYQLVLNALDPADQRPIACTASLPLFGS